jgi:2-succinyl-5-enolpyruvyl-6-hydroxy-3-cyclohexene-1-carboxylate synthase
VVERRADLVSALRAAANERGLSVLHVRTDRGENLTLHRAITAAVRGALDAGPAPGGTAADE